MAQIISFDTMNTPQNTMVLTNTSRGVYFPLYVSYLHAYTQQYLSSIRTLLSLANTWLYLKG